MTGFLRDRGPTPVKEQLALLAPYLQDEPERYMANVHAFLLGQPLPESPYDGHRRPEGYEGPP
jgi:hypothetical protein